MVNCGLQQMMNMCFPKQKLNPNSNPNESKNPLDFRLVKKLSESDSIWIRIWTVSHPYLQWWHWLIMSLPSDIPDTGIGEPSLMEQHSLSRESVVDEEKMEFSGW